MGSAMARNLAKADHKVCALNRSGHPGIHGVEMVSGPADAFAAEAVFTMLSDDPAIREVLLEPVCWARPGLVHVVTSTISVAPRASSPRRMKKPGSATSRRPISAGLTWPPKAT